MALVVPEAGDAIPFADVAALHDWLAANHASAPELWMRIYKKGSGVASVTWAEAVPEMLCWGWIDGMSKSRGPDVYVQRFTPRRPRSNWSQVNVAHVERLIAEGRMQPAGLAEVEAAKADGRWERAYAGQGDFEMPAAFLAALKANPAAAAFYETLDRQNRFAIYHRLATVKREETRARKIAGFVAQLARGERIL